MQKFGDETHPPGPVKDGIIYCNEKITTPLKLMKISKSSPDLWTKLPEYTLIRRLTTHLYSTRACLILLQCYNASYFLCSLDKTVPPSIVSPIYTMFTNLVIQAVNLSLWNVTLSRHFHLLRLQLQYQNLVIQKHAWLIEVNKKREKLSMTSLAMLQCIDTWKPPMFSIMSMQRFPKFR